MKNNNKNVYYLRVYSIVFCVILFLYLFSRKDNRSVSDGGEIMVEDVSDSKSENRDGRHSNLNNESIASDSAEKKFMHLLRSNGNYDKILNAMTQWLEEDESAALDFIEEMGYYLHGYGFSRKVFGDLVGDYLFGKYGGEGSVNALASYDYGMQLYRLVYERVIERWAVADQEKLKKWWYNSPMVDHPHTLERLLEAQFKNNDPVAAIRFHEGLPDSDARKYFSTSFAYKAFVDMHKETAIEYLENMPPNEAANTAFWRLAVNASEDLSVDVDTAVRWVDGVYNDDSNKKVTLVEALSTFAQNRSEEYEDWLKNTSYFEDNGFSRDKMIERINSLANTNEENKKMQNAQRDNPDSPYYVPPTEETSISENL